MVKIQYGKAWRLATVLFALSVIGILATKQPFEIIEYVVLWISKIFMVIVGIFFVNLGLPTLSFIKNKGAQYSLSIVFYAYIVGLVVVVALGSLLTLPAFFSVLLSLLGIIGVIFYLFILWLILKIKFVRKFVRLG